MEPLVAIAGLDEAARAALAGLTVCDVDAVSTTSPPDVIVIGPSVSQLHELQRQHAAFPDSGVVVVTAADDPQGFRRALSYAPGVPVDVVVLDDAETLGESAVAAAERAALRRGHRALVASLTARRDATDPPARLPPLGVLLQHAPISVLVVDRAGAVWTWNARAAELLDLGDGDVGRHIGTLVADVAPWSAALARSLATGASEATVAVVRERGRALELTVVATLLQDGTPAGLILIVDVTARVEAERVRDELSKDLRTLRRAEEFLLRASDVLATATTYAETLDQLASVAVPTLADLCLIDVVQEDGSFVRMAAKHADASRQGLADELRRSYPPLAGSAHPGPLATMTRAARWATEVDDDFLRAMTRDVRHFALVKELDVRGYVTVPLIAGDTVLGSVTLVTCGDRTLELHHVQLAEALAGRVAAVVAKARRYDREHRIAEGLQRSMLPTLEPVAGLDVAARYVPASKEARVGGDWYDVFPLTGSGTAFVIGDVVGHDMDAAAGMGQLRNAVRGLAWHQGTEPAEVLTALDQMNDTLHMVDLATMVYGVLTPTSGSGRLFTWSNAGHPPPLLITPEGSTRFLERAPDVVLGVPAPSARRQHSVRLERGASVLLYTDGLVETRADQLDSGMTRLRELVAALDHHDSQTLCTGITRALDPQTDDDVALLALRVR